MGFRSRLSSRSLIRVSGTAAHEFLQGLFTNDLRTLVPGGSMWGCFLNHTGRVMCDACLYQSLRVYEGHAAILVDVHRSVADNLKEHLLDMRMRKRVQIQEVSDDLVVVATSSSEMGSEVKDGKESKASMDEKSTSSLPPSFDGATTAVSCISSSGSGGCPERALFSESETFLDPRSFAFSSPLLRTVVPAALAPSVTDPEDLYDAFLYAAGVGEGPDVFRPSKTLPFEGNADFLHGVSFHKGCYLGQELTHRTHVMLVTRKRTVSLRLGSGINGVRPVEKREGLFIDGQRVGEVLAVSGEVALGLMRLRYVDSTTRTAPGLSLHDTTPVSITIPTWWEEKVVRKMLSKP